MHPNAALLQNFYKAFNEKNASVMRDAYAPTARFADPVFPNLQGKDIGDMWTMLCENAQEFRLEASNIEADDTTGKAHWEAHYLFQGKRRVHNIIDATFRFENGKIVQHDDQFDFWRWSRQALGAIGLLLGWAPFLQKQVQGQTKKLLQNYQRRKK